VGIRCGVGLGVLNETKGECVMSSFKKWLDVFVEEKGIDLEEVFSIPGPSGENLIPVGVVIEHMKIAPAREQAAIKDMIVRIDFINGDVVGYFRHLARAIAI
jgi:hypothetical protein